MDQEVAVACSLKQNEKSVEQTLKNAAMTQS